ncbi:unnamed protein product [Nesidiocoris tenuis]|uniref:Uncharacterized protein n=1 Tax=Nesidiocoris tenuis TaxID=355587 RepID=A0A6H5GS74_9HEMI|nr:unnamed protein product [Nesidiocoris tenuis]
MASTSVIKQVPPKDTRSSVNYFLANFKKPLNGSPNEMTRTALMLLKSDPTVRDAVLEYLAIVVDKATLDYLIDLESQTLNTVVGILSHLSGTHQGAIENAMADLFKESLIVLLKLAFYAIRWEATGTLTSLPVLEAVYDNLKIMSNLLFVEEDIKVAHIITELLRKAVLETKKLPSILISRSIVRATISYFYLCLMKSGQNFLLARV